MVVFYIKNQETEYAKCFSVLHFLDTGEEFELDSSLKILLLEDDEIRTKGAYDFNRIYKKCKDTTNTININNSSSLNKFFNIFSSIDSFCFYINDMDENDIVHLHYFELIKRQQKNCYLLIESNDDNYFRISDFYQIENHIDELSYSHRFFKSTSEKSVKRFALKNNSISRHFLPLLRTQLDVYALLSQNIFDLFTFSPTDLLCFREITDNSQKTTLESLIQEYCIKLIEEINAGIKKSTPNFNWSNYKDILSETSIVGLCYFLSYLHTTITTQTFEINHFEITHLLLQSEDFAIGTMQILENALKHADYGYFCYRLHNSDNKKLYLKNNYEIDLDENTPPFYLEVLISDFNTAYDIPQKFIYNLKNRSDRNNIELLSKFASNLELKDFFSPSDECKILWNDYYSDKTNIALHYGLNIFEQIVASSGGKFLVKSSNELSVSKNKLFGYNFNKSNDCSFSHIPGTQFKIILPVKNVSIKQKTTGLKVQLDSQKLKQKWKQKTLRFIKKGSIPTNKISDTDILFGDFKSFNPQYKERSVIKLFKILENKLAKTSLNTITVFDVENFRTHLQSEIFAKALICLLGSMRLEKIAIINASHQFMSMFIRTFGLLYYKQVTRNFLSKSEIYICGNFGVNTNNNVEILFKNDDIHKSVLLSKQVADYKGEYSSELSILENISEKCEKSKSKPRSLKIFPFDILIKNKNLTLFQEKTVYDLNQNLQHYHFGCRLTDVHMKVGSKVHITSDFYEATLLFGIENYISRFAYLLASNLSKKVKKECEKDNTNNIVLIGYETYSETLVIETQRMLNRIHQIKTDYLIYDDSATGKKFRGFKNPKTQKTKYVIIVPIGSTLTTHDKIVAELMREFKISTDDILANLCVVLVRDILKNKKITETEKFFWESIDESKIVLKDEYTIGKDNSVDYIVSVQSRWEKPDKCSCCFPKDLCKEKPILKVNKASVIPMIMMGITENNIHPHISKISGVHNGDISLLKKHLMYGHISREDNHFEYYINTDSLAIDISNQEDFNQWLKELKKQLTSTNKDNTKLQFDFVVAPQHSTNAEFVMQINEKVFGNPASVIFLDVKKEYRDNVKTKFSNLTQLYNNLNSYGRSAVINFHYVDDTITTGETFNRTKSLIQSLFPSNCNNNTHVEVNVFSSIILLLSRCSSDTKLNYVSSGRFFNYFELYISALRNYKDACVLCNKHNDYEEMRKLSSTNSMEKAFFVQAKKYEEVAYTEKTISAQVNGYEKMFITHELNNRLSKTGNKKNDSTVAKTVLSQMIIDVSKEPFIKNSDFNYNQYLCVFFDIISTPFVSFRKSVLSASFELLLKIAEFLIFKNHRYEDDFLPKELRQHICALEENYSKRELESFIEALFQAISQMGANFVMRRETINAFFTYIEETLRSTDKKRWIIFYSRIINQSLMTNRQDSRVLWLENILKPDTSKNISTGTYEIELLEKILLLENTLILSDTLYEAVSSIQNTIINHSKEIITAVNTETSKTKDLINKTLRTDSIIKIDKETNTDLLLNFLFDVNGKLRNYDELKKHLEKTINSYFCEAFRAFCSTNDNSPNIEQLLDMSVLCLLLIPNGSLYGAREDHLKFYDVLVNQIKAVLNVNKVQLFMTHNNALDFICSSDGNNVECDSQYEKYLKRIVSKKDIKTIGDTYYLSEDGNGINAIKIANNHTDDKYDFCENDNNYETAWYLVFNVDPKMETDIEIHKLLANARNLLVMRERLLLRFKKDYDNNLYAEFSELRKKVKKLTDDKAGGHTPFVELSEDFDYLYKISKAESNEDKEKIANYMKLITDLLISKLYVCHINEESYPKQIETRKNDIQYNCLKNYKDIILCANNLVLRKSNSITVQPQISFEGVDWDVDFAFMKKSTFIWISIFYALIMNALRHGWTEQFDDKDYHRYVEIEVKVENECLVISNAYVPHKNADKKEGITLETVKAFFSHYGFDFDVDESNAEKYIAKIPLKKTEK